MKALLAIRKNGFHFSTRAVWMWPVIVGMTLSTAWASGFTSRVWTSSEGESLNGTLISYQEGLAIIRNRGGDFYGIPLSDFSEKDQGYLERLAEEARAKGITLNRAFDLNYRVVHKDMLGGEIVSRGEGFTDILSRKIERTDSRYFVVLMGTYSKLNISFEVTPYDYRQISLNQNISINDFSEMGLDARKVLIPDISAYPVLRAQYGAGNTWNDVTELINRKLRSGSRSIHASNSEMGGDPIFGVVKELRIVYLKGGIVHEASVREGGRIDF